MKQPAVPSRHRSRAWLFGPFVILGLLAAGWSGFWFYAKGKSEEALDRLIAREAGLGRRWTCQDRKISGFPFRFEAHCAAVSVTAGRADGTLSVGSGALAVVAQIYNPQHMILKAAGPATITAPDGTRTVLRWSAYTSSFHLSGLSFDRVATVIADPEIAMQTGEVPFRATSLELHGRRHPARFHSEGTVDVSLSAKGAKVPALDARIGNDLPADMDVTASLTRALVFLTGIKPANFDLWSTSGGRVEITRLAITKGQGRLEASGELGLDDQRRLAGRLEPSVAGIDRIAGFPIGSIGNLGGLLSGRAASPPTGAAAPLRPLPALEFRNGRIQAGPLRIPGLQLPPLY